MFACCFISERTAGDHAWFRYYFLETMVYMLLAQRYIVPVHAACVAHDGSGVLLCGWSGAGKSTLAFACARAGWTFIGDDSTWLLPGMEDRAAVGRPHLARFREDAPQLFPELEGSVARARPNGKLTIEVPLSAFPHIRTASRCQVGCVVLLNRQGGGGAEAEAIPTSEIVERLIEVPLSAFLHIRTASRCQVGCVVLLNRQGGGGAEAEAIPTSEIVERLIG